MADRAEAPPKDSPNNVCLATDEIFLRVLVIIKPCDLGLETVFHCWRSRFDLCREIVSSFEAHR